MKTILNANEIILKLLKRFKKAAPCTRMMKYCVETRVDDGVLLFNVLTREMVLLTDDEYTNFTEIEYLKERWFVVPEEANEKEYASFVRWYISSTQKNNFEAITAYSIFTTTDCNARCFYCYEHKSSKIPMSNETALAVVQYIKNHCGGKKVKLLWFGGEPLYNQNAMDIICTGLREEGIEYISTMISNGYLFDDEALKKAVELWNLKSVQITLDGTEDVYNRIKAYIYRDGNPYQIVLKNIEGISNTSIKTIIRLNMDLYNADNLLALCDELKERFGGKENIVVYANHLFKDSKPMVEIHSEEEWELRESAMDRIEQKLSESGLLHTPKLTKTFKKNHCMADIGTAVTILPDGNIGLCDKCLDSEFIGHIDSEGFDSDIVESWRETMPEVPECGDCFFYPECIKLKKCGTSSICFSHYRRWRRKSVQHAMLNEYKKWLTNSGDDNDDEAIELH